MLVELRVSPGSPFAEPTRRLLVDCVATLGVEVRVIEVVGHYPSPTVLVDGVDVMRPNDEPDGDQCRLDVPTPERVLAALRVAVRRKG